MWYDVTMNTFEEELRDLLNTHSKEGESNTPDFIMARYLTHCMDAFAVAVGRRDAFGKGGMHPVPTQPEHTYRPRPRKTVWGHKPECEIELSPNWKDCTCGDHTEQPSVLSTGAGIY